MRFRSRLQKMKGVYAPEVPPDGAEAVGKTEDGRTIYERTVHRVVEKRPKLDENGRQLGRGSKENGTWVPAFELVRKPVTEQFTLRRGKHGNNRIQPYDAEAAERDKRIAETRERKQQLLDRVADQAVELGLDLDKAAARILGVAVDAAPEPAATEAPAPSFDADALERADVDGDEAWRSDGELFVGSREDAEAFFAEQAV